jgi:DNA-binding beta-propeller fold protein YncE
MARCGQVPGAGRRGPPWWRACCWPRGARPALAARLPRRHRARGGATATAGAPATGTRPGHPVTVYVLMPSAAHHDGAVVPVDAATGTAGPAIGLHTSDFIADGIAVTPDGKTAYVIDAYNNNNGNVVPIRTATSTAGPPIPVGANPGPIAIAVTP